MANLMVLGASILLQFTAAILALRMVRISGASLAWPLIAIALSLMGARRSITFYRIVAGDVALKPDVTAELIALLISALMLAGVLLIGRIFAERQQAEEALRESENRFRNKSALLEATFENMTQGIAVFDAGHTLVAFNPQYGEILGLPSDYLHIGINRADIFRYRMQQGQFYGADVEATVEERLASARQPEKAERTLPNGRSYAFDLTPTPDGGYIITLTDITERHAADKRLQQAQKMEAVGQLTGGIAHDFNNLLAVSLGNVELAEEVAESGGDVRPFLATIKRTGERGAALTNQLLAFSRKQTLVPQVIDAGDLVGGMADRLRRPLGGTIEGKVAGADGLGPGEVAPHELESAILNLALNARDAMPSGGTLSIQTTNVSLDDDYAAVQAEVAPGEYVLVAVTDTGTGMAQEVIDHAFDPFFTTKEVGRGSGLGLSMVYYQRALIRTHCPFALSDGHDLPWLVDEFVPGFATQGDNIIV